MCVCVCVCVCVFVPVSAYVCVVSVCHGDSIFDLAELPETRRFSQTVQSLQDPQLYLYSRGDVSRSAEVTVDSRLLSAFGQCRGMSQCFLSV